jgi:hypothetical protein
MGRWSAWQGKIDTKAPKPQSSGFPGLQFYLFVDDLVKQSFSALPWFSIFNLEKNT